MMRRADNLLENEEEEDILIPQQAGDRVSSRVVSGESDDGETDDLYAVDPSNPEHADPLFDENLDGEDEAYVYRNMRSGVKETITVVQNQTTGEKTTKRISVYKPRYSDAQLQCPCCFQICLLYTSPSPRDVEESRMPSSA